jgi:hypothetical protein
MSSVFSSMAAGARPKATRPELALTERADVPHQLRCEHYLAACGYLTTADQLLLFARWPHGEILKTEASEGRVSECFLAKETDNEYRFALWRDAEGLYVRGDTQTGQLLVGATLARVMPVGSA